MLFEWGMGLNVEAEDQLDNPVDFDVILYLRLERFISDNDEWFVIASKLSYLPHVFF